jgi:ADP-ribose pyrophosphatase YjhB (NUDIX family)
MVEGRQAAAAGSLSGNFHYRVAGVALHEGRVLLQRTEIDDFWSLPGGHVELYETAAAALRREMREELGVTIKVLRFLWVAENFFHYQDQDHHELGLYFLMQLPADAEFYLSPGPYEGDELGLRLELRWFPCDEQVLAGLPVLPAFLAAGLVALPDVPQHVLVGEDISRRHHPF